MRHIIKTPWGFGLEEVQQEASKGPFRASFGPDAEGSTLGEASFLPIQSFSVQPKFAPDPWKEEHA